MEEYYVRVSPPKGQNHKKTPPAPLPPKKIVDKAAAADFVNVGERAHGTLTSLAYQVTGKRSAASLLTGGEL